MNPIKDLQQQADKLNFINELQGSFQLESDSCNTGIEARNNLAKTDNQLVLGYILETCPTLHAYKVAIAGGKAPILCCSLQTGGGNPSLIFDSSFYAAGSTVLVALQPQFGVILGVIPLDGMGNDLIVGNKTSHASQNYPDESDKACLDLGTKERPDVGLRHFGHGLPQDTTDLGESGHTSATGVRQLLNAFMALIAVDDYTGLWLFDEDKLLRLSGINVQVRSSGREIEYLNDNGEYIEYSGNVVFPWEQLGYTKVPTSEIITETPKNEWRNPNTWKSFVEPAVDKAKPFHRVSTYGGFLGQGGFTQVVAPDPSKTWNTFGDKEDLQGLIRHANSLDGWMSFISSEGAYFNKRGLIPAVTRVNRPDDTSTKIGDNPTNYNKTNKFYAKAEIPVTGAPMEQVMGLQDGLAYQQNFKELLPFLQHTNDYYIPEDSVLNKNLSRFAPLGELKSKQLVQVAKGPKINVVSEGDGIPGREVQINPAEVGIACLSDGSEVLYGGCGEEIRMAGGSISFDAPGDLWFRSGRKIILWAGDDIEIRAKGHVDVSTTEGSVRIKAEGKLSMLGGNNEKDGVLIESRGTTSTYTFDGGEEDQFGGIILKSAGNVGVLGETIYIRSGINDGGSGIFFDANNGNQSIYTLCANNINFVENSFDINYSNLKTGDITATHSFKENNVSLAGDLDVSGKVQVTTDIFCGASIRAVEHIYTGESKNNSGYVSELNKDELKKQIEEQEDTINQTLSSNAISKYESSISNGIAAEGNLANEDTLKNASFSFRKSNEYNLPEDFAVYESRWQNIASNANQGTTAWKEKGVSGESHEDTYPFPGKKAFTGESYYVTQEWTLTDYANGTYKDRWQDNDATSEYKDPKYGEQQKKSLNEYPVIG